eukprot:PITA_02247
MPKALDPFWEYGTSNGGSRANLSCKLCGATMTGGVTRLKYHLAKLPGHDVGLCTVSSAELVRKALEAIEEKDRKKEEAERNKVERAGRSFGISSPDFGVEDIGFGPSGRGSGFGPSGRGSTTGTPSHGTPSVSARSSFFVPRTGPGAQPGIKSLYKKKEKQEADRLMGRVIFWSDLPLTITKTNPYWQPMCDAIAVVGPGYKSATYEELRGPILQAEKQDINSRLAELKKTWEATGCTVMSDGMGNDTQTGGLLPSPTTGKSTSTAIVQSIVTIGDLPKEPHADSKRNSAKMIIPVLKGVNLQMHSIQIKF